MFPEFIKTSIEARKDLEIVENLSNLAKIPTEYYRYESGLKLLHSLARIEHKNFLKKENKQAIQNEYDLNFQGQNNNNDPSLPENLKRHSSFSLDHYYKGVYKLRKFEKSNDINIEGFLTQQTRISKVNFMDLIPKTAEEIIEPHMIRLINLHASLYDSVYEKGLQDFENVNKRDEILLIAFQKNINTLLKTANVWLSKELLRNTADPTRYYLILDKILELLNNSNSIGQIISAPPEYDNDWIEFIKKIPIYTEKVLVHMSIVCENAIALNISRSSFLEIFKKIILNHLEKKEFAFYGLNLFLNLINREAFEIVNRCFWPISEFREFIISNAEETLETIKINGMGLESINNTQISDTKVKGFTIKYLSVLSNEPSLVGNLIISFGELLPVAQQVILDKFETLARKNFLDYVSNEILVELFRHPKNNEKLIIKFIEKYIKYPETLIGLEEIILPEINDFCLEYNFLSGFNELIHLNTENEFSRIQNHLILKGNEKFFSEIIPILFEKNIKLAENLFIEIHVISQKIELSPEQTILVNKIQDIFFKNENNFFKKNNIFEIFANLINQEVIPPLIMRTIHKVFQFFFKKEDFDDIFDGLIEVVSKMIEKNMMENERIWNGMKKFFKYNVRKCKNLLQNLPENYKKDFFQE